MNKEEFREQLKEAMDTGGQFDIGNLVICDFCDDDYTHSKEQGGILFASKGTCPACQPRIEASAKRYGEESHIQARCPAGMSFADWIRSIRPDNKVTVTIG